MKRKYVLVFGAAAIALLMVLSATAVTQINSKSVMKIIEKEDKSSSDFTELIDSPILQITDDPFEGQKLTREDLPKLREFLDEIGDGSNIAQALEMIITFVEENEEAAVNDLLQLLNTTLIGGPFEIGALILAAGGGCGFGIPFLPYVFEDDYGDTDRVGIRWFGPGVIMVGYFDPYAGDGFTLIRKGLLRWDFAGIFLAIGFLGYFDYACYTDCTYRDIEFCALAWSPLVFYGPLYPPDTYVDVEEKPDLKLQSPLILKDETQERSVNIHVPIYNYGGENLTFDFDGSGFSVALFWDDDVKPFKTVKNVVLGNAYLDPETSEGDDQYNILSINGVEWPKGGEEHTIRAYVDYGDVIHGEISEENNVAVSMPFAMEPKGKQLFSESRLLLSLLSRLFMSNNIIKNLFMKRIV